MYSWACLRSSLLLVAIAVLQLPQPSHAAALTNTVIKQVSSGELSIAINFAEWSGNFNYTLTLPSSAPAPLHDCCL